MASLGTLPDEVLLEIITAMSEEAHRRANIGILPVPVDPAAATSAAAATAAASPMERITDDALLQVCTSLYLCTSPLPPLPPPLHPSTSTPSTPSTPHPSTPSTPPPLNPHHPGSCAAGDCGRAGRGEPPRRCPRSGRSRPHRPHHPTPKRLPAVPPAPNAQTNVQADVQADVIGPVARRLATAAAGIAAVGTIAPVGLSMPGVGRSEGDDATGIERVGRCRLVTHQQPLQWQQRPLARMLARHARTQQGVRPHAGDELPSRTS